MSPPRFLVPGPHRAGESVELPEGVAHHARRVLRLRAGDELVLFDGVGNEYRARLETVAGSDRAHALIDGGGAMDREARLAITLVQALVAPEKIDWLVEKCVEAGAARIVIAPAARSVARLEGARQARRLARWQDIAAAACAQCGRNVLPAIELAPDLPAALRAGAAAAAGWILDPQAPSGLGATGASGAGGACIAVGPEGGFTTDELGAAEALGYRRARLGPRVLRTETAGLAAVSALLALNGEYS
jgi:16S rRNA (uracil1498-N3)-methyltransferase